MKVHQIAHEIEFTLEVEHGIGTLFWESPQYPFLIRATPFWEDQDGVVVYVEKELGMGECLFEELIPLPDQDKELWTSSEHISMDDPEWRNRLFETPEGYRYLQIMQEHLPRILTEVNKKLYS